MENQYHLPMEVITLKVLEDVFVLLQFWAWSLIFLQIKEFSKF